MRAVPVRMEAEIDVYFNALGNKEISEGTILLTVEGRDLNGKPIDIERSAQESKGGTESCGKHDDLQVLR
jgi:hypothetical protein